MTSEPKRRRRLAFRIAASLFGLCVALILCEGLVRVLHPAPVSAFEPYYERDAWGTRRPKPGFKSDDGKVTINSLGFRDSEEFPEKKPADETRVLFLGDSFLYAARLDEKEILPKVCERLLGEKTKRKIRAINTGCPAYGTNHERAILEHEGLPLSPDLVVLCFFVGNDVTDVITTEGVYADRDHVLHLERREDSGWKGLLLRSRLFQLVNATETYQRLAHKKLLETAKMRSGFLPLAQQMYEGVEATRLEQWRRGAWERPPLDQGWKLVDENLQGIVEISKKAGARVAVLAIPDEIQVDASLRARILAGRGLDEKDYDLEQPQRRIGEIARAAGVPCVSVLEGFREQARKEKLYLELDTHWNARGHELAAAELEPVLESLLERAP